ncbi:hypothetical protein Syn7502_02622 [Synechococcus sp. PCC 7502]|nr:hypothetical protein Syn7502_02622 [Synechococcus sp. PCC 7502]
MTLSHNKVFGRYIIDYEFNQERGNVQSVGLNIYAKMELSKKIKIIFVLNNTDYLQILKA